MEPLYTMGDPLNLRFGRYPMSNDNSNAFVIGNFYKTITKVCAFIAARQKKCKLMVQKYAKKFKCFAVVGTAFILCQLI